MLNVLNRLSLAGVHARGARQADRFGGRSSVSTWLMSIACFKALSARRRRIDAELDEKIEATAFPGQQIRSERDERRTAASPVRSFLLSSGRLLDIKPACTVHI